jgi:HSP20 family molecular chaperone IbpA
MNNTALTTTTGYRPSLLGRNVFDDVFGNLFNDSFPTLLRQSTQGYPLVDIYRDDNGDTVMEFALAGFSKDELSIEVKPENSSVTVRAESNVEDGGDSNRRIARRSFEKTYVNYDNNLDLSALSAVFENGLLSVTVPVRPDAKPLMVKIK